MALISVVLPVYNGEKTIKATIKSVVEQTYTDWELIIINADSQDATLEIISQIKEPRLQVFNYPKANVAVNRNRGISHTQGEFITFIDADDLWTPDKLEFQYLALQENPEAAVAYSWTDAIDEQGNFLHHGSHSHWQGNVLFQLLLDDFIGSGSNVMLRKQAFHEVGGFDEILTNAQDTDMWLRLAAKYPFIPVKKVQIFYRISDNSMSSALLKLESANLQVIERAFTALPASLQYLKPYKLANLYKYLSYKALAVPPGQQNTFITARLLCQAVKTDPFLLDKPVIYKAILKLLLMALLPAKVTKIIFSQFPRLANTTTFLGYIKLDLNKP